MNRIWFIADTHFYHSAILDYEDRPFKDVADMNRQLIKKWNNKVSKLDRVFMLGDFVIGNKDKIREITQQLNGHKILVMGNHDNYSPRAYMDAGFDWVSKCPIILDDFFILSHKPMYLNEHMPYVNIYGHVHGSRACADYSSQSVCVSVERKHMLYSPISMAEVKSLLLRAK